VSEANRQRTDILELLLVIDRLGDTLENFGVAGSRRLVGSSFKCQYKYKSMLFSTEPKGNQCSKELLLLLLTFLFQFLDPVNQRYKGLISLLKVMYRMSISPRYSHQF